MVEIEEGKAFACGSFPHPSPSPECPMECQSGALYANGEKGFYLAKEFVLIKLNPLSRSLGERLG